MTAIGHVGISLMLGFAIVVLGVFLSKTVSMLVTEATGIVMLGAGGAYGIKTLLSREHKDYAREAENEKKRISVGRDVRYFAVLGGALSPDLSILPILLLSVSVGTGVVAEAATVFSVASVLSLLLLVTLGSMGFSKVFEKVPPKYNNALVGFVIAAVGAFILLAG